MTCDAILEACPDDGENDIVCGEPAKYCVTIGSESYGSCDEHVDEWDGGSTTPQIVQLDPCPICKALSCTDRHTDAEVMAHLVAVLG